MKTRYIKIALSLALFGGAMFCGCSDEEVEQKRKPVVPPPPAEIPATPKKIITTNLAVGKFYKMTATEAGMQDVLPVAGFSDGTKLTDESLTAAPADYTYVGWKGSNAEVVIDLGSLRKTSKVRVHALCGTTLGLFFPDKFTVEISKNKREWRRAPQEGAFPAASAAFSSAWSEMNVAASEVRYVKIVFDAPEAAGSKYAVDEVEVVGEFRNGWKCAPHTGCYHGAYAPLNGFDPADRPNRTDPMGIDIFERYVGKKLAITLWYRSMQKDGVYNYFDEMQLLREQYSQLNFGNQYRFFMYGWEPVEKTAKQLAEGVMDEYFTKYFADLRLSAVKMYGPVWIRPMNEQNSNWVSWGSDPANYVKAWRRMYNIAEQIGVTQENIFVWSPAHASYPDTPANKMDKYYPGDQYVDWVGVSLYPPEVSDRFPEEERYPVARFKEIYDLFNYKPIMASEGAFSNTCDKERWTREWFEGIKANYPMVKAMVWENHIHPVGNVDRRIHKFPEALKIYQELVKDPYWLDAIPTSFDN